MHSSNLETIDDDLYFVSDSLRLVKVPLDRLLQAVDAGDVQATNETEEEMFESVVTICSNDRDIVVVTREQVVFVVSKPDAQIDIKTDLGRLGNISIAARRGKAVITQLYQESETIHLALLDLKSTTLLHRIRIDKLTDLWPIQVMLVDVGSRLFAVSSRIEPFVNIVEIVDGWCLSNFDTLRPLPVVRDAQQRKVAYTMARHPSDGQSILIGGPRWLTRLKFES